MQLIDIIVETPKGSHAKYTYDTATRFFKLKKLLPEGMVFPYDFGFIPNTVGGDGDPLDVLLLWESGSFAGCQVACRIIGAINATQQEEGDKRVRNDRYIAVPEASKQYKGVKELKDIAEDRLGEIIQFFINYTAIEKKGFEYKGKLTAKEAWEQIKDSFIKSK